MQMLPNLGLWGDGDEVCAIEEAFRAIRMKVPVEDARSWITVGDVWKSALARQPNLIGNVADWDAFRQAICCETLAQWERVAPETHLLDGKGHSVMARLFTAAKKRFL